jgi:hypothetical protein
MTSLLLEFRGPYRCTKDAAGDTATCAFYRQSPIINDCGIYLQAARLADAFRVAYVGRAACFADRLPGEFRDWLTGKDRRSGETLELDPVKYCRGVRSYGVLPTDHDHRLRLRRQVLDCTVVFLADLPIETTRDAQERIEGALMRHLKNCASPVADFLYNKPVGSRRYSDRIDVRLPDGVRIEGLEVPFTDV